MEEVEWMLHIWRTSLQFWRVQIFKHEFWFWNFTGFSERGIWGKTMSITLLHKTVVIPAGFSFRSLELILFSRKVVGLGTFRGTWSVGDMGLKKGCRTPKNPWEYHDISYWNDANTNVFFFILGIAWYSSWDEPRITAIFFRALKGPDIGSFFGTNAALQHFLLSHHHSVTPPAGQCHKTSDTLKHSFAW